MSTPADYVSQELAALAATDSFATRFTVEADLQLRVEGVGDVPLPVTVQAAHKLCGAAQPALHGYKDQTRLDPHVRDTWEIPASHVHFDSPSWSAVLERALKRIQSDLALPAARGLKAELHNLLVYAPGQFFATHRDSEKVDGMVGTLVITLPSSFTGGEFVVSHQDQTLRVRGSASRLSLLAFYADCYHEVRPVKQGYRVVLTYNLILEGGPAGEAPVPEVAGLAAAVQAFWQTGAPAFWEGETWREPPDRLVYLLDHEYTQSGLSWAHLKGADATRVAALRRVAEQLDAEIFLTLADVRETWSAEAEYFYRDRWDDEDGEEEGDDVVDDASDVVLGELIDSDIELRHWVAPDGSEPPLAAGLVANGELCLTRDSVDCTPFQSEYEGYMGNYGNTVDRWYHRAAVVMWPRERAFVIRARQSPSWAVAQIASLLQAGDVMQAQNAARRLLPFWKRVAAGADAALFDATLAAAAELDNADTAAEWLAPFALGCMTPDAVPSLLRLLDRHGLAWCGERLEEWAKPYQAYDAQVDWLARTLPVLTHAMSTAAAAGGAELAAILVEDRWHCLQDHFRELRNTLGVRYRAQKLVGSAPALLALIRGGHHAGRADLCGQIVAALQSAELPLLLSLKVLRIAHEDAKEAGGLARLHGYCVQMLTANLAVPERAVDDWSIQPPADCVGELGEILAEFLESSTQRCKEWPLAQARRQAIRQIIHHNDLPVRYETRRKGRPYTLVLEKTNTLFERAAAERRQWTHDLAWLRQTAASFAGRAGG